MKKVTYIITGFLCAYMLVSITSLQGVVYAHTKEGNQYNEYRAKYSKPVSEWEKPHIDDGISYKEMQALPKIAKDTKENPYTEAKMLLGKKLFFEPKLSKSGQIACASCHNPELAFGDSIKTSFGHDRQRGKRNAPNIMMSGFFDELFWDGRAKGLESQALMPITNPIEMAHEINAMQDSIARLREYYPLFILAFGETQKQYEVLKIESKEEFKKVLLDLLSLDLQNKDLDSLLQSKTLSKEQITLAKKLITKENIAKAIATYERSLVPKNTRFNRFLNGDYKALSDKEIYGLHIFRTKGRCMNCHYGVALSDGEFHNIGLSFYGRKLEDLGRYEISKDEKDLGAFKTPSLIAVSKSAPYMHNGIFPTLKGVINMYNAGFPTHTKTQNATLTPKTSKLIQPLNLNKEELEALEEFLLTL
ncbi:cytochrome-c peroxidase [Helicobacter bilis]|uniref:cytochrome-c peroxidase n=1 Tax=Helicobacter bilis TaxID=37372 RepID=UPI002557CF31|nr:cytochrome c peroxidase [Helicobacter bilis]